MTLIYFIQAADSRAIKIGVSSSVAQRLAGLQTAHPHKLRLLLAVDGDLEIEQRLHVRFAESRLNGEWFNEDGAVGDFVRLLAGLTPSEQQDELNRPIEIAPESEQEITKHVARWEALRDACFAVIREDGITRCSEQLTRIWGPQGRRVSESTLLGVLEGRFSLRLEWMPWFAERSRDAQEALLCCASDTWREYVALAQSLRVEVGEERAAEILLRAEARAR